MLKSGPRNVYQGETKYNRNSEVDELGDHYKNNIVCNQMLHNAKPLNARTCPHCMITHIKNNKQRTTSLRSASPEMANRFRPIARRSHTPR